MDHKEKSVAEKAPPPFPAGTRISHPKGGLGTVKHVDDENIKILFDDNSDQTIIRRKVAEPVMQKVDRTDAEDIAVEVRKQENGEIPTPTPSGVRSHQPAGEHKNPIPPPPPHAQVQPSSYQPKEDKGKKK